MSSPKSHRAEVKVRSQVLSPTPKQEVTEPLTPVKVPHFEEDASDDEEGEEEDEFNVDGHLVSTYVVIPPDGGWGWVVVVAAFFCNMVVDGTIFSYGVLLNEIIVTFDETKPKAALVGSLLSGFYLLVGPLVSALANRFGFRAVTILGSVIAGIGFALSYYATNITSLCITYGVIGGIGFGMIYVPAVITVGFYFEKWRALATGIAVCGSGMGTFILAPLLSHTIAAVGLRYTMLIQAGMVLCCAFFGCFFRPLAPVKITMTKKEVEDLEQSKQAPLLLQRIKEAHDKNLPFESTASLADVAPSRRDSRVSVLLGANNNAYPTAAAVMRGSTITLNENRKSSYSLQFGTAPNISILSKAQKRKSAPPDSLLEEAVVAQISSRRSRRRTNSTSSSKSCHSRKNSVQNTSGARPFYRDDIYFGGSLQRLPQYTSQANSVGYHMSVSRLPTLQDVEEEETSKCVFCPEAVKRTLATMLDTSLLNSPSFLLLSASGCITMMGFYVPFMFIVERAEATGVDPGMVSFLIAGIGISNTLGRVACGVLSSFPGVNALFINNVALSLGGLATILSGLSTSTAYQIFYITIFGLAIACFASLRSIIIVDLLGLDKLTNAFGLLLLFQGVAAMIGAPLAGWFQEVTNSYDAAFWFSGTLILLSAIVTYPLNWVNRRERVKNFAMAV